MWQGERNKTLKAKIQHYRSQLFTPKGALLYFAVGYAVALLIGYSFT